MNQYVNTVNQFLIEKFDQTKWDVQLQEVRMNKLTKYTAYIQGNYQRWLGAMLAYVQSEQAQKAARIILLDEMFDCHSIMLEEFHEELFYALAERNKQDANHDCNTILAGNRMLLRQFINYFDKQLSQSKGSKSWSKEELGLYSTTLVMLLENASYIIIEHLKKLEQDIKGADCKPNVYIMAHSGEMEFGHIDLMRNAFESEYQLISPDRAEICVVCAVQDVKKFAQIVFF